MYLIDTNVISELRKCKSANPNVVAFFTEAAQQQIPIFLSVITMGELRRGVDLIRYRGDRFQTELLEDWLNKLLIDFGSFILPFDQAAAQVWGKLRVPHPENPLDKEIAATALVHSLILVTCNVKDFIGTGVEVFNRFL